MAGPPLDSYPFRRPRIQPQILIPYGVLKLLIVDDEHMSHFYEARRAADIFIPSFMVIHVFFKLRYATSSLLLLVYIACQLVRIPPAWKTPHADGSDGKGYHSFSNRAIGILVIDIPSFFSLPGPCLSISFLPSGRGYRCLPNE